MISIRVCTCHPAFTYVRSQHSVLLYSVQTTAAVAAGYGTDLSSDRSFTYIITIIIFKKQNAITTTPVARTVKYMFYGIIFNSPVLFFLNIFLATRLYISLLTTSPILMYTYILWSARVQIFYAIRKNTNTYTKLLYFKRMNMNGHNVFTGVLQEIRRMILALFHHPSPQIKKKW